MSPGLRLVVPGSHLVSRTVGSESSPGPVPQQNQETLEGGSRERMLEELMQCPGCQHHP